MQLTGDLKLELFGEKLAHVRHDEVKTTVDLTLYKTQGGRYVVETYDYMT